MKKLILSFALIGTLAACEHSGSPNTGKVPAAKPELMVPVMVGVGCIVSGLCF